ncbi:MAG: histone deacetylase family protein [Chloroflexota bacterium]|nr:histone deacetylase family protein [Chloroflexota bacterium]
MAIAILYRDELQEYDFGPGHPFRGDRFKDFMAFLRQNLQEDDNYRVFEAGWASDEDLLKICDWDYIEFTRDYFRATNLGLGYGGRFYQYHSADNRPAGKTGKLEEAARLIIGQAKLACDLVQSGKYQKAVSIGGGLHHAKRNYGEGFCLYNDVAFAGTYLLEEYELDRVMILDTDAHAGNGTSEYFYSNPKVLFIDLHQNPYTLYPGTGFASEIGSGEGKGFKVNVPLPVGAGYDSYKLVFDEIVEPLAAEFKPQIIVRNGGSDPHFDDGLTGLGLPVRGFQMIGERVRKMAESCGGKEVDLIASGYNNDVLPYAWLALISGLAGFELVPQEPGEGPPADPLAETRAVVAEVKNNLRGYWRCFT